VGKSIVFDRAPDYRCYRGELVGGEVNGRHGPDSIGRHFAQQGGYCDASRNLTSVAVKVRSRTSAPGSRRPVEGCLSRTPAFLALGVCPIAPLSAKDLAAFTVEDA
jgi:hypothetical protein